MKHFLAIKDLNNKDMNELLDLAAKIKANPEKYQHSMTGKSLVMIFQKTSTRTRISFEIGMTQMGGHAAFLEWKHSNLAVGNIMDEVKCIGGYADLIMARVYAHEDIEKMANAAGKPVINGLSNFEHPCQILADLLTIKEKLGKLEGVKVAFVGDGNNVCNSLISGCTKMGAQITVATPKGYEPDRKIAIEAQKTGLFTLTTDPKEAVKEADIIYTDTWVSLGQEGEAEKRIKAFKKYQVNSKLVTKNALIMHCLPAHRGYEITDYVLDGKNSIVFEQSGNRLHVQKAVMLKLSSST